MKQIRRHLTYANVMSSLAVFLILGGATAFAAVKKVGANEIKANSIKTGKIVKEAVTAGKIKNGAVTETKLADGAVTTNKIADNAVTTAKIAERRGDGDQDRRQSRYGPSRILPTAPCPTATTANVANAVANVLCVVAAAEAVGEPRRYYGTEGVGTARVIINTPTANCHGCDASETVRAASVTRRRLNSDRYRQHHGCAAMPVHSRPC